MEIRADEKGAKFAAFQNAITIVIDVLRATTSITTILDKGAVKVIPVKELNEARTLKADNPDYLLAGERNNFRPPDFQFGNSPLEYLEANLENSTVVFSSSNCTVYGNV